MKKRSRKARTRKVLSARALKKVRGGNGWGRKEIVARPKGLSAAN